MTWTQVRTFERIRRSTACLGFVGLSAMPGYPAGQPPGFGLLEIPAADQVSCRQTALYAKSNYVPPAVYKFDFLVGRDDPIGYSREIDVVYAANGVPLELIENNSRPDSAHERSIDIAAVRFEGNARQIGIISHIDKRGLDTPADPAGRTTRAITKDEVEKARRLADWLWQRRCAAKEK